VTDLDWKNCGLAEILSEMGGEWWVKETGNEMLRIRCAVYNDSYDIVFERYKKITSRDVRLRLC